jgi:hypothetical protein
VQQLLTKAIRCVCLATCCALQIRLSVNSRTDPPFSMIEFNQLDSPREACAVCYLDMTAEPDRWHEAVRLAVKEVRRYVCNCI